MVYSIEISSFADIHKFWSKLQPPTHKFFEPKIHTKWSKRNSLNDPRSKRSTPNQLLALTVMGLHGIAQRRAVSLPSGICSCQKLAGNPVSILIITPLISSCCDHIVTVDFRRHLMNIDSCFVIAAKWLRLWPVWWLKSLIMSWFV